MTFISIVQEFIVYAHMQVNGLEYKSRL